MHEYDFLLHPQEEKKKRNKEAYIFSHDAQMRKKESKKRIKGNRRENPAAANVVIL